MASSAWRAGWTAASLRGTPRRPRRWVWFAITLAAYIVFPYDLEVAAKGWSMDWVAKRTAVIFSISFVYYSFFFAVLYVKPLAGRKYRPGVFPTFGNICHDMWYWSLGVLQWSLSECAMTRLWATGVVPYIPDRELLSSPLQLALLAAWILLVPVWRDMHFYFTHRFSHIRSLYKYVHALHHRNTDPQPFSGLCMHPIEHLLYFSNALVPVIYLRCSPLIYMWIFIHLGLAPGAGHSGYEDHWQADQYHYVHHSKFECNYGSPSSAWLDQFFGTFREKLGSSGAYTGEYKDDYDSKSGGKVWSAQGYLGLQSVDHMAYTCFVAATSVALFWAAVVNPQSAIPVRNIGPVPIGQAVASLVSHGPILFGILLCLFCDRMSWRWPFHKDRIIGSFGFFAVAGWLVCVLPVYHFGVLLCMP
mmetsp:Transcript_94937/g.307004  ORF Transcript_94937/g.307004 Transcript_94937/m.307004 type:complete len:417 (-) Transcript_94937:181-1431(-)